MAGNPKLNITFDVDYTNYLPSLADETGHFGNDSIDEMAVAVPQILSILKPLPLSVTWYIRLDSQMTALFGEPDFIFKRYAPLLQEMQDLGHRLGWHHHAYCKNDHQEWQQNTCEAEVLKELEKHIILAQQYQLNTVRMGWGYHTNATMALLSEAGFKEDSSAIPRPQYPWTQNQCDWSQTGQTPYHPARENYQLPSQEDENNLTILESPITTLVVSAPYDNDTIIRYLNPAYHPAIFRQALNLAESHLKQLPVITTITHPYEILPQAVPHGLLSFSLDGFQQNLQDLMERFAPWPSASLAP